MFVLRIKEKEFMSKNKFKSRGRVELFDKETRSLKLSKLGNPLEKLDKVIDFEMFRVPDARTIWLFQNNLIEKQKEEELFYQFHKYLECKGILVHSGEIVDATLMEVPRQRNQRIEDEKIKFGEGSELWKDNPDKRRQEDIDARWTIKRGKRVFGYKSHIKVDRGSKLIERYEVTSTEIHDSQTIEKLIKEEDKGQELYGNSAYIGYRIDEMLRDKGIIPQINERSFRGRPLTGEQRESNRIKSKIRCRVKHVFGFMRNSMNRLYIKSVCYLRAKGNIGLINLVYNLCRYEQIVRLNILQVK
jgi:IS5 family transposase